MSASGASGRFAQYARARARDPLLAPAYDRALEQANRIHVRLDDTIFSAADPGVLGQNTNSRNAFTNEV